MLSLILNFLVLRTSHKGRELFYRSGRGEMVAVQVETEATFSVGQPEVLWSATEFGAASLTASTT